MRFTPAAIALSAMLAVTSSVGISQKPDLVDPQSVMWADRGMAAMAGGSFGPATDAFETALAIDPRNRRAYLGLAQVSRANKLPGKAIRFYDDALKLNPNDPATLQAQGLAMLEKGAVESARGNLARIKALCKTECAPAAQLSGAIASALPAARMSANSTPSTGVGKPSPQ